MACSGSLRAADIKCDVGATRAIGMIRLFLREMADPTVQGPDAPARRFY